MLPIALQILLLSGNLLALMTMTEAAPTTQCPDICYCYEDFVTCREFADLDLTLIPANVKKLVLSQGQMEEVPAAFFARAVNLKVLELNDFNARVVRGGAFRGLRHLQSFVIKGSSFDIVEPDAFSGIDGIYEFLISDSYFGRVGKHAFAEIANVSDWRIWSTYFARLSDEAFYGISKIHSLQFYQNNISYIGHDIFAAAREIEYVNFYANTINVMSNGSLSHIRDTAELLVVYANKFQCVCENAWMTTDSSFAEYITANQCFFSSDFSLSESLFRLVDVTEDVLCPMTRPEGRGPLTSTLGTIPSVIEEMEIWSDHEGLNPEPETVQEHLFTGNVSVNDSLHDQSGMNLTSSDSMSQDWNAIANSTLSSASVEPPLSSVDASVGPNDSSVAAESEMQTESSSVQQQSSSVTISLESESYLATTPEMAPSKEVTEPSPTGIVPVISSSSLFDSDKSSYVPFEVSSENFDATEFVISPITFDASLMPVVDESSISSTQESMTSTELSHELSSLHEIESSDAVSNLSSDISENVSTPSSNISESALNLSSDISENVSTLSESDLAPSLNTREPASTLLPEASSIPASDSDTLLSTSSRYSSPVVQTTMKPMPPSSPEEEYNLPSTTEDGTTLDETLFITSKTEPSESPVSFETIKPSPLTSSAIPSTSSTRASTLASSRSPPLPSKSGSTQAVSSEKADKDVLTEVPRKNVLIIDAMPSESTKTQEPTPTFPIDVPFQLPERAKIASAKDKTSYEKAQRDKQIYAHPYSTSAVEMDTGSSGRSTTFSLGRVPFTLVSIFVSCSFIRHHLL